MHLDLSPKDTYTQNYVWKLLQMCSTFIIRTNEELSSEMMQLKTKKLAGGEYN